VAPNVGTSGSVGGNYLEGQPMQTELSISVSGVNTAVTPDIRGSTRPWESSQTPSSTASRIASNCSRSSFKLCRLFPSIARRTLADTARRSAPWRQSPSIIATFSGQIREEAPAEGKGNSRVLSPMSSEFPHNCMIYFSKAYMRCSRKDCAIPILFAAAHCRKQFQQPARPPAIANALPRDSAGSTAPPHSGHAHSGRFPPVARTPRAGRFVGAP
jgi:hypothetical protein